MFTKFSEEHMSDGGIFGRVSTLPIAVLVLLSIWMLVICYNVRRNPLSQFSGPFTAKFSNLSYCQRFMGGRQPYKMLELHNKYGPVVRVAPNELSFTTASSWKDIYGQRKGHRPFVKSDFYDGGNFAAEAHSIVSVRDPDEHAHMRKYLYDAFSDRSLREQEHLVAEVVDQFIEKIGEKGKDPAGIDIVMWFNLATFDIIGSLAFGQTFGGITSGTEHFWVSIVVKSLGMGALADCFKRFPMAGSVFQRLFPSLLKKLIDDTRKHEAYTMDLVQKKMSQKSDRKDFLTKILESRDADNISTVQIAAHASDFVIAGSETTATALGCITYYLQKNPNICRRLREEIRSSFQSYDQINNSSTATLTYLNAVILEGMRVYPPLPFALPRVVPPGGDTVDGFFLPGGTVVSTNPFAASMSSSNFKDPWTFNPERWLGNHDGDNLEACQPFSTGIRACLGRSLGWMELRTFLSKIHFKYDLDLLDPMLDWHRDSEMYTLWKKPVMKVVVRPTLDGTV